MTFPELVPLGWGDRWVALFAALDRPGARPGRVIRHDGTLVLVASPDVQALPMLMQGESPVVGDWVVVAGGAVLAVLPRRSLLRRQRATGEEQALAANADVALLVCGLDRPISAGRLQREVALSWDGGATPTVVLNKIDLVADLPAHVAEVEAAVPGVDVVAVSTKAGTGLDALRAVCRDRSVVLLGESGAGKSSLVNLLAGADVAATGNVRSGDGKGRHTTTTRQLHVLPGGGVILDSPGIRAVALWVEEEAIDATFPEIELLAADCHFRDCSHNGEPGCAVAAGVDAERLTRWRALRREAVALARTERERRQIGRKFGRVAKEAQERKGRHRP